MHQYQLLIASVALCAIGLSFTDAYGPHVCQQNVKIPYTRKVNKTEYIPFEENTYNYGQKTRYREVTSVVDELAYKYEIKPICCPGYVGSIENCMRTSTTPKEFRTYSEEPLLAVTNMASVSDPESSTGIFKGMQFSEKSTEIFSDKSATSEHSTAFQSKNTEAVTDVPIGFAETTSAKINVSVETIATKVHWWSFPIWFLCIVVIVTLVAVLVKMLVHRNARRAYVVNKKAMSTESHC